MRKILSLVLVLSMVLGSFSFAFATPADVEGTDYENAVTRLSALEILSGYSDGTFKPEKTITRAEFAKIMANILGVGEAAKYAAGATKFDDVAADHWAAGYINVVSDMKIINGYGNGSFGPQDNVTYAQAVTMIVRALGYEPKASAIGGYPGGYLAVAAEEDITDDVSVVNTLAATRGDVALMVDAALDVPLMYQKTWGQYPEYTNEDESKTLLTEKLGVDELSGTVVSIPDVDSTIEENEIKLKYEVSENNYKTKTLELLIDANYPSLLGLEVTVWADGSDAFFLDIDTDADDIVFDTASGDSTDKVISLYNEDDDFDWDNDAKAYLNFDEVDLDEIPENAYGYVVFDSKDEVTYANFFKFDEIANGVVTEVKDGEYVYYDASTNDVELELADYDDGIFVYTDKFVKADTDIIDVNSAIFAWEYSDELYLVVKNETVSGTLEKAKEDRISVDGETIYEGIHGAIVSDDAKDTFKDYDVTNVENLDDEAVKVVLDLNGEALLIYGESEATSSTVYGIVTFGEVSKDAEITVFTKDDEEVTYTAEDRGDFTGLDEDTLEYLLTGGSLDYAAISFKLNSDGEIDNDSEDIVLVSGTNSGEANTDKYEYTLTKSEDKKYVGFTKSAGGATGRFYIDEDTVILQAVTDTTNHDLSPDVIDYDSFVEMAFDGSVGKAVVFGDEDKDANMIVMLDEDFKGSKVDFYYGIVTDSPWKDSGDYFATIDVFGEGENDYMVSSLTAVGKGDMIAFTLDSNDEVEIDAVYDLSEDDLADVLADVDNDNVDETVINQETNITVEGKYVTGTDTWKLDSGAVVYELTSSGKLDDEVGYNRIGDSDDVTILLDDEETIVAAIINKYGTADDETPKALDVDTLTPDKDEIKGAEVATLSVQFTEDIMAVDAFDTAGSDADVKVVNKATGASVTVDSITISGGDTLTIALDGTGYANANTDELYEVTIVAGVVSDLDEKEQNDEITWRFAIDTLAPPHAGLAVAFTDTDTTDDEIGGDITITKATDESDIVKYTVVVNDGTNDVVDTEVTADGSATYTVTVPADTAIAAVATVTVTVTPVDAGGNTGTPVSITPADVTP